MAVSNGPNTSPTDPSDDSVPVEKQGNVQCLTREEVAVRLMEDQNQEEVISSSISMGKSISSINEDNLKRKDQAGGHIDKVEKPSKEEQKEVNTEQNEEDHVDGMLSPTYTDISMMDGQETSPGEEADRREVGNDIEGLGTDSRLQPSVPPQNDPINIPIPELPSSSPSDLNTQSFAQPKSSASSPPNLGAPVQRYPIPNRRPKGWISSLNHPRAVSNMSVNHDPPITPLRSSSTSDISKPEIVTERFTEPSHQARDRGRGRISSVHVHRQHHSSHQGRRVSGAMQYAFQQQRHQDLQSEYHNQNRPDQIGNYRDIGDNDNDETSSVIEHTSDPEDGIDGGIETEPLSPEDEARIRYEVGLSQDQDEIWMEYVRNQLSSLFPDFFGTDPSGLLLPNQSDTSNIPNQHEHPNGDTSVSSVDLGGLSDLPSLEGDNDHRHHHSNDNGDTAHSHIANQNNHGSPSIRRSTQIDLFSPTNSTPIHDRSFTTGTSTDISSLPTPPLRSNAEMLRGNVVIPNVRDEISGLREEIERLRNVVGGLAQGLGVSQPQQQQQPGSGNGADTVDGNENVGSRNGGNSTGETVQGRPAATLEAEKVVNVNGVIDDNEAAEIADCSENDRSHGVTEAFIKTADISANIIRLLDKHIDRSKVKTEDGQDVRNGDDVDDQIFTSTNLERIMEFVKSLDSK